jgi:RNA polymerase sigma-70 factor, ECF subfamily
MRDDVCVAGSSISQISAPLPMRRWRTVIRPMSDRQVPENTSQAPTTATSDGSLVARSRSGDQDAATQLYLRYGERLTSLVKNRCSADLACHAGVEDIVQSVFVTFFRRIGEGRYHVSEGDVLWNLLAVIARNRVRTTATYYYAAKRNAHRTIGGQMARQCIESQASSHGNGSERFELLVQEILERLPLRSRLLVKLRLDGFTTAESAQIARCSRRTVERVIHATRLSFSELLGTEG